MLKVLVFVAFSMLQVGFSKDGAKKFMLMTKAVIDGKTKNETTTPFCFSTNDEYLL